MSDSASQLRELGEGLRTILTGLLTGRESIKLGKEIRRARLYTEINISGKTIAFEALGARSCSTITSELSAARGTTVYNLQCDLTYFAAENTPLGPVRIVQDPRIANKGWIYLRRDQKGDYILPGLSYFNQHLIFHVGDKFFYYPRAWQVVSAITTWPPEYHQYHHLEDDTPIFDFIKKTPNAARKGISTISIEGPLTKDEEQAIRADFKREIDIINSLPATKMSPEDLTPAQGEEEKGRRR